MKEFAWAIIGPGGIARHFAAAVNGLAGARIHSVWGRDQRKASQFAVASQRAGQPPILPAPDIGTLLADDAVDAVYIATPHPLHAESIRLCLAAGKAVLCEKPLVTSHELAIEMVQLAHAKHTFLMEALWTRCLPVYARVADWLQAGTLGEIRTIQSSFGFTPPYDPASRLFNPELAGGALLDIGIYNVAMSRWVLEMALGACPADCDVQAQAVLAPTGVDQRVAATLTFPAGQVAQFVCAFDGAAANMLRIIGSHGSIVIAAPFWAATSATLHRPGLADAQETCPLAVNGFEYEIEETMRCVRAGLIESPLMPHRESLAILSTLDRLRSSIGVRYPFE